MEDLCDQTHSASRSSSPRDTLARLARGHGKVVDSPLEAMDAAIRRAGG